LTIKDGTKKGLNNKNTSIIAKRNKDKKEETRIESSPSSTSSEALLLEGAELWLPKNRKNLCLSLRCNIEVDKISTKISKYETLTLSAFTL